MNSRKADGELIVGSAPTVGGCDVCKDWKLTRGGGKKTDYVHPEQGRGGQRLNPTKNTINYQP